LQAALDVRFKVTGSSVEALATLPVFPNTGLMAMYVEGVEDKARFTAITDRSFSAAAHALANIVGCSSSFPSCQNFIENFWIVRPRFFVPSFDDIMRLRGCIDGVGNVFEAALEAEDFDGSLAGPVRVVALGLGDLVQVAYSGEAELFTRLSQVGLAQRGSIQSYLEAKPRLTRQLMRLTVAEECGFETPASSAFAAALKAAPTRDPDPATLLEHAGDFLDYAFPFAQRRGEIACVAPLWQALVRRGAELDMKIFAFEARKVAVRTDPVEALERMFLHYLGSPASAFPVWDATVGSLWVAVDSGQPATSCLPIDMGDLMGIGETIADTWTRQAVHEGLALNPVAILDVNECILTQAEQEKVSLSPAQLAGAMHMVRLLTSATAAHARAGIVEDL
jgi:hypothetical protein